MNKFTKKCSGLVLSVILAILSGCVSAGSSPQARFYSLRPLKDVEIPKVATPALKDAIIGVGPLEIPAYLDRPQIVTRGSENELELAELHRWAEPLEDAILRVVAQNLMSILPDSEVLLYPWSYYVPVKYQVVVEIVSIEAVLQDEVRLSINWSVLNAVDKKVFLTQSSLYSAKVNKANYSKSNYNGMIAALNQGLYEFSLDIAKSLAAQASPAPN
jgi:uncharacterized lipoprotein YmbA